MIDTLVICSPSISAELAEEISKQCIYRIGYNRKIDKVEYELTTGDLKGSWDSRVSIKVSNKKYVNIKTENNKSITILKECEPYIQLECSLAKFIYGYNVFLGPLDVYSSISYMLNKLSKDLYVNLPDAKDWEVKRIDWAECFFMDDYDMVQEYFRILSFVKFPRRKDNKYSTDSIHIPGTTTSINMYHKGPEFRKHSYKDLIKKGMKQERVNKIQSIADRILRVEISIKKPKLTYDYKKDIVYVKDLTIEYLQLVYKREIERLIREGEEMKTVRDAYSVRSRLIEIYGEKKANTYLKTWYQMTTFPIDMVKEMMSKSTFYDHRKALEKAGVSWIGSDIEIVTSNRKLPVNFKPYRNSYSYVDDVKMFELYKEVIAI